MSEFKQREELIKDLQLIKEAVSKNNSFLKKVPLAEGIKLTALLTGLLIFLLGFLVLLAERFYGNYAQIPGTVKLVFYISLGCLSAALVIIKVRGILRTLKNYSRDINLAKLVQELYTRKIVMTIAPYLFSMIVLIVYFSGSGLRHLIVPFLSIFTSLVFLTIHSFINLRGMMLSFLWLLISGFIALFLAGSMNAVILLFFTFGVGMIILYGAIQLSSKKEKRD